MTRQPLNHRRIATTQAIDDLFAQVPAPAPVPMNIIPFSTQELHCPAQMNSSRVFSLTFNSMARHVPSLAGICEMVTAHACNTMKIGHDDPAARNEVFEAACRAAITLIAGMMNATAYIVFSDEQPNETKAPEVGQGQRATGKVA